MTRPQNRRELRRAMLVKRARLLSESLETRRLLIAVSSDQTVTGTIATPTATVDYEINLGVGDSIVATVGETATSAFDPQIALVRPDGSVLTTDSSELVGEVASSNVTVAGTWKLRISDAGANDTGSYRLTVAALDSAQAANDGDGGVVTSGQRKDGTLLLGDLDVFTVALSAGDVATATLVDLNNVADFTPYLRVYGPTGTFLSSDASELGTERTITAATTGTYYFVASDSLNGNAFDNAARAGSYRFRMVKAPGATQSQDDADGGAMTTGQRKDAAIELGDLDLYTVSAQAGDAIIATVAERNGDTDFEPRMRVYGPTGTSPIGEDASSLGTERAFTAPTSGTYYFLVSDDLNGNAFDNDLDTGDYTFRAVRIPASPQGQDDADGGAITSGQRKDGTTELGDIDVYTIGVSANEPLFVSAVERRGDRDYEPVLRVFGPTGGAALFNDRSSLGSAALLTPTVTGTYYIVVTDDLNGNAADNDMDAGEYTLRAVNPPDATTNDDADGGTLTSGQRFLGTIDRGDYDVFRFTVDQGDTVLAEINSITNSGDLEPRIRIYNAAGAAVGSPGESVLISSAAATGSYFAVIDDDLNGNAGDNDFDTGDYAFSLAIHQATQTTDADSGALPSGQSRAGAISIGDNDIWRFSVTAGQSFTVRLAETGTQAFDPHLIVVNSAGTVVYNSSDESSEIFTLANPPATGTYAAFVRDAGENDSGSYSIALNTTTGADTFAPTVLRANYRYNDPLPQIRVEFSEPVAASFSIDDFTLKNLTSNTTIDNFDLTVAYETLKDNFVVTFDAFDGRVLPDGNYRLTIPRNNITDPAGNPLPADFVYDFFVLAGDIDRDRVVDFDDLVTIAQNYNGLDRSYAEGNINYSSEGEVNFEDLVLLAQKYNKPLLPALSSLSVDAGTQLGGKRASVAKDILS